MKRSIILTGVLFLFLAVGLARAADEVEVVQGRAKNIFKGNITRDDIVGIRIRVSKAGMTGNMEFARKDVRSVKYECLKKMHYTAGESLFKQERYEFAMVRFEQAVADKSVNRWAKQYALRYLAQCHEKLGKTSNLKKAVQAWSQLKDSIPGGKTRFMNECIKGMVDGYTKLKDWDKASATLASLAALGGDNVLTAKLYRAQISEWRGRFPEAGEAYRKVVESRKPKPTPKIRARALAGLARCAMEAKNWGQAGEAARKIISIKGEVPEEAAAVAHQVRGEVMLRPMLSLTPKELSASKDKREKVLDGILDMLRPVVQYKGSPWAEQRALYYVGFWSEKLERAGEGPKWMKRADTMYKTLRSGYPGSKWGKLAAARLKAMRGK